MEEPLVPNFSKPVLAANAGNPLHGLVPRGMKLPRVEGFRINVSNCVRDIKNITHDESRESLMLYLSRDTRHLWLLHPSEYITKLDIATSDVVIVGLRIYTSKHISPWFGKRTGIRTTIQAEDGFCINAFCGGYGQDGCTQIGVVFVPLEVAEEGHHLKLCSIAIDSHDLSDSHVLYNLEVETCFRVPRAVVVIFDEDNLVIGVRVVSRVQYERYCCFNGTRDVNTLEHWMILTDDERITSVKFDIVRKQVTGICVTTNFESVQSFGRETRDDARTKLFNCDEPPGRYICRFQVLTFESLGRILESLRLALTMLQMKLHMNSQVKALSSLALVCTKKNDFVYCMTRRTSVNACYMANGTAI